MISAVIFDMDGTLLDTETLALRAWEYVIDKYKLDMDLTLPIESIGLTHASMSELFRRHFGDSFDFELYHSEAGAFFGRYRDEHGLDVKKGFFELSDFLKSRAIGMYVATSTYRDAAEKSLRSAGIAQHFDGLVCGDEIVNGKPAPDIFLKAAERTGYDKDRLLIAEDSANGVRSAAASGIRCVYIKDIKDIDDALKKTTFRECGDLSGIIELIKEENKV